ncbi:MAG: ATP-dependent RNA helicase [Sphaerochaetaceae bacterium]|jgi:RNA helicase HrpA
MSHLPVYQHREKILEALKNNQVIVVESPTGSGKTTQIPLILNEAGYAKEGIIGVTQPRRIATLSVTSFIEKQLDAPESYVAYKMRFSDTTKGETKIKVMTDGILLMEAKNDPLLSAYSVMLIDEAHERSLNIDFVLGLLKNVLAERSDFKVIISSATINTKVFSSFFNGAPIISIKARQHPVEVIYQPLKKSDDRDEIYIRIRELVGRTANRFPGDILIFLPGEFDIKMTLQYLSEANFSHKLLLLPLFGRLSKEEQERVFIPTPKGKTKVVVATNIAETSVTIDGITTVIDSGIAKLNYYNQKNFTSSLITLPISQSSCEQRSGRAGRTAPGRCYRLYSEDDYNSREMFTLEEILRTDLSEVIIRMSELGIFDWERFPFITRPKSEAIKSAEETLLLIEAIDKERHLTSIGEMMVKFPLLPRHARVIVEAMYRFPQVMEEVLIAISFLSTKTPFILPPGEEEEAKAAHHTFNSQQGDFISYLTIFNSFTSHATKEEREEFCKKSYLDYPTMVEIFHIEEQLSEIVSETGFPLTGGGSNQDFLCCLAAGLLQYVCIKSKRNMYRSLSVDQIFIHPGSAWFKELPQFLLAGEIVQTSRLYARTVSPLKREWLDLIHPALRPRLLGAKTAKKGEKEVVRKEAVGKSLPLYGKEFQLITIGKAKRSMVIIPYEELDFLYHKSKSSKRAIRNYPSTLMWRDHYIHYGDKLPTLLNLRGKLKPEQGILASPPAGTFGMDNLPNLVDNLDHLLAFCRLKRKKHLGFVQLVLQNNGQYRFSSTRYYFEALDTSIYALSNLVDEIDRKKSDKEYQKAKGLLNELVTLFDE